MIVRHLQRRYLVDEAMYIKNLGWINHNNNNSLTYTQKTRSNLIKSNQIDVASLWVYDFFFIFCTKLAIFIKMHIHIHIAYTFASEIRDFPKRFQLRVDGRIKATSRVFGSLWKMRICFGLQYLSVFTQAHKFTLKHNFQAKTNINHDSYVILA